MRLREMIQTLDTTTIGYAMIGGESYSINEIPTVMLFHKVVMWGLLGNAGLNIVLED